jgi:hypothetical protein
MYGTPYMDTNSAFTFYLVEVPILHVEDVMTTVEVYAIIYLSYIRHCTPTYVHLRRGSLT